MDEQGQVLIKQALRTENIGSCAPFRDTVVWEQYQELQNNIGLNLFQDSIIAFAV